jgi:glyoxylase-like metal-dependent hydrolase (beta-lactamase superfamily II)
LAEILRIPVVAGPDGGRPLPYPVQELTDGELLDVGDVGLRAVVTPGPSPAHLAFVVGEDAGFAISGDLDGRRGARAVVGSWSDGDAVASRDRLRRRAPAATWLPGHPPPAADPIGSA